MALEVWVIVSWIGSGRATRTPHGPNRPADWQIFMAHFWESVMVGAFLFVVHRFIARPWRRDRQIPLDGFLVIAFLTASFQDQLSNYSQNWFTYNTAFTNWGSWTTQIPGWIAPNSNLVPEPVIFALCGYPVVGFGATVMGGTLMTRAKARWPQLRRVHLIAICFASVALFDLIIEVFWLRLGLFSYPGTIDWLTVFRGRYYQFPVYEAVVFGGTWTAWACLRHFRDDKGRTIAERGIDDLRASPRQRSALRLLALIGAVNAIFLVTYNIPMQWFALQQDNWPVDIQNRSYLTDGICGPGTDYACPGPAIPHNRPDSYHLDPGGRLVAPEP